MPDDTLDLEEMERRANENIAWARRPHDREEFIEYGFTHDVLALIARIRSLEAALRDVADDGCFMAQEFGKTCDDLSAPMLCSRCKAERALAK